MLIFLFTIDDSGIRSCREPGFQRWTKRCRELGFVEKTTAVITDLTSSNEPWTAAGAMRCSQIGSLSKCGIVRAFSTFAVCDRADLAPAASCSSFSCRNLLHPGFTSYGAGHLSVKALGHRVPDQNGAGGAEQALSPS